MRSTVFLALALSVATVQTSERIVGGYTTSISRYPFTTALLFQQGNDFAQSCVGTVINNRSVLSAARCFYGTSATQWRSRVGSINANSGGAVFSTYVIVNHPNFNAVTLDSDISILRISGDFTTTSIVRAASLSSYAPGDNQVAFAIGWGATSYNGPASEQLRQAQIWTVNQNECASRYAELGRVITDNMLCSGWLDVGGRGQCQGDDGGPLIHNGAVVGVYSWGNGCGLARYPSVNTRVSPFITWIQSNA